MLRRVHHVQISVPLGSEEACRHFYGTILGLEEIVKPESLRHRGGVWFLLGDIEIHLGAEQVADRAQSRRHIAFQVDDLHQVRQRLQAHEISIDEEPIPIPGWDRFYCRDPFGNRIEFIQRVDE
ncbi:MAG: VOC family protein [Fimbriimonadales bacterium]